MDRGRSEDRLYKRRDNPDILHPALEGTQGHSVSWALGLTWSLALEPLQSPLHPQQTRRGPGVNRLTSPGQPRIASANGESLSLNVFS